MAGGPKKKEPCPKEAAGRRAEKFHLTFSILLTFDPFSSFIFSAFKLVNQPTSTGKSMVVKVMRWWRRVSAL